MSIKIIYDEQDVWKCSMGGSGMVLVRIGASRRGVGGKSVALRNGDQEDWEMANGGKGTVDHQRKVSGDWKMFSQRRRIDADS